MRKFFTVKYQTPDLALYICAFYACYVGSVVFHGQGPSPKREAILPKSLGAGLKHMHWASSAQTEPIQTMFSL
jgi:hypothetical protein